MSRELYGEICNLLNKNKTCHRHSYYQLKHFILNREITHQSRLRRCLNEIEARKSTLDNLFLSIEEANDDIELIDLEIKKHEKILLGMEDEIEAKKQEIAIRKAKRRRNKLNTSLQEMNKTLIECEEEIAFFLSAFQQLEKIEPLKDYDDLEANEQMWSEQYAEEVQLRLMLQKPLDLELVRCILSMSKNAPIRSTMINILDQIKHSAKQQQALREEMDRSIEVARTENTDEEAICQKESQH